MSNKDIKVPNIGEFKDVEVIEVLIKKGQKIKKNDPLITIESDKSSVEIPSSDDGTIISLNVKIGDKVSEGDKIIEIKSEKEIKETSAQELPKNEKKIAEKTFLELKENFDSLQDYSKSKDKYSFIATRRDALDKIGGLEEYFLPNEFPYSIPQEFDNLPRLLGRAKVNIKTSKGDMQAIVDGFNAPLTAGAFIDLSSKNFYKDLPINRAEEFFVLQTGDPIGENIGYIDPETSEERHVPLEIRIPNEKDTFYNQTFEDLGLYTETPTLPFATLGTLGWSHSNTAVDDGSSQFFFFLYEAELNPAGRNLIDGRNAAFGYVVDGFDVLEELTKDDTIISIDVLEGIENLKLHA